MASTTVGFAVAESDREQLERLVARFGDGNRSEFLRRAMKVMAVQDRAERLRSIQARAHVAAGRVWSADEVNALVRKVTREAAAGTDG